ncbi:hypothetical protein [Thioclava sp.]|uniref:hypothetical protein n=1 Tax=Thioclava sp. TaxID=1933450 RepID=UPI003AA8E28F
MDKTAKVTFSGNAQTPDLYIMVSGATEIPNGLWRRIGSRASFICALTEEVYGDNKWAYRPATARRVWTKEGWRAEQQLRIAKASVVDQIEYRKLIGSDTLSADDLI